MWERKEKRKEEEKRKKEYTTTRLYSLELLLLKFAFLRSKRGQNPNSQSKSMPICILHGKREMILISEFFLFPFLASRELEQCAEQGSPWS